MNDINVSDLDQGYEKCKELSTISSTNGENLLSSLSSNIASLKSHWISTDATAHINNLISVYRGLDTLINDALSVTHDAAEKIIRIQRVRSANASGSGIVGESLPSSKTFNTIAEAEPTTRYYVDAGALTDLTTLQDIFTEYKTFLDKFTTAKDELLSNWLAGANREQAVSTFETFNDDTAKYTDYFNRAIENLSKATNNISQI